MELVFHVLVGFLFLSDAPEVVEEEVVVEVAEVAGSLVPAALQQILGLVDLASLLTPSSLGGHDNLK